MRISGGAYASSTDSTQGGSPSWAGASARDTALRGSAKPQITTARGSSWTKTSGGEIPPCSTPGRAPRSAPSASTRAIASHMQSAGGRGPSWATQAATDHPAARGRARPTTSPCASRMGSIRASGIASPRPAVAESAAATAAIGTTADRSGQVVTTQFPPSAS